MTRHRPHQLAAIAGATLAAALAAAGSAHAVPAVSGEFALTGQPQYLAKDQAGNVWTPLSGGTTDIARIGPDGSVEEFDVAALANAKGITADADGRMWVTKASAVARFDPANPAGAQNFPAADVNAQAITLGSDGNLWTGGTDVAVKIDPASGGATPVTATGLSARGVAAGGDGALYFASFGDAKVYRITTAGNVTSVPVGGGGTQEVAAGPGTQIAYAAPTAAPHVVGRLNGLTPLGETQMASTDPFGLVLGNDNAYWVARFAAGDIARVTTDGQATTLPGLSAGAGPRYIAKGAGNTLWVGLQNTNKVARITGVEAPAAPQTPPATTPPATGQPPATTPPTASPLAPALTAFRASSRISRGRLLPALTRSTRGGQLRFTVSEPATVRFRFAKATSGRKVGSSCVKRTRRNASKKRCVRYVKVAGSFTVSPKAAGSYRVRFQGRLTKTRRLSPGRYRVTATATGASGATARAVTATFTLKAS